MLAWPLSQQLREWITVMGRKTSADPHMRKLVGKLSDAGVKRVAELVVTPGAKQAAQDELRSRGAK